MENVKKRYLKVILLGDQGVGKTTLIRHYCNSSNLDHNSTVIPDFVSKEVKVNDTSVLLRIWDTSGQERYQSLSIAFYRNTDVCILVYDSNSNRSFENIAYWFEDFKAQLSITDPSSFPFILVGNKADRHSENSVSVILAKEWCKINGNMPFLEASIKEQNTIDAVFEKAAMRGVSRIGIDNIKHNIIVLKKDTVKKNTKSICDC